MHFCSVECWDAHVPTMRHRDAWAIEKRAPSAAEWERLLAAEPAQGGDGDERGAIAPTTASRSGDATLVRRRIVGADDGTSADDDDRGELDDAPREILIVVSKLKQYIKARSGMNTSDGIMARLSDHVRSIADEAIRSAAQDDRRTVLDRDIPPIPRR